MLKDIKVKIEDKLGTLADLGEALGDAGVNIEGLCGPCEEKGFAHILVDDAASAGKALQRAGIQVVKESEILVLDLADKPGELGKVCRSIADAGVNIDFFYAASDTRIVLGVSELEKAEEALS